MPAPLHENPAPRPAQSASLWQRLEQTRGCGVRASFTSKQVSPSSQLRIHRGPCAPHSSQAALVSTVRDWQHAPGKTSAVIKRIERAEAAMYDASTLYAAKNQLDLVNGFVADPLGAKSSLFVFWSKQRLMSVEARRGWVEPDLAVLPFPLPG